MWLSRVKAALEKQVVVSWISWSVYTMLTLSKLSFHLQQSTHLLSLFLDNVHSVVIILHSMNVIKAAVQRLNPDQVPVVATDQPFFALAKEVQWIWPDTHGEDHFVIIFGGVHIQMGVLRVSGPVNSLIVHATTTKFHNVDVRTKIKVVE